MGAGEGTIGVPPGDVGAPGTDGTVPGCRGLGVPAAVPVTTPAVQSTTVDPGVEIELPRKPTACANGFPLALASPRYTRTTTRFMLAMLVSK